MRPPAAAPGQSIALLSRDAELQLVAQTSPCAAPFKPWLAGTVRDEAAVAMLVPHVAEHSHML